MKLPDFLKFEPLNALKQRMGISADTYGPFTLKIDPGRLTAEELDRLTGEGIDVYFNELTILPDGTLAYKDNRVLLYIRDVHVYGDQEQEPRYHLFNCRTLVNMSQQGRFNRYVISVRTDGQFNINLIKEANVRSVDRRLCVCQLCLNGLSFKGFNFRTMNGNQRKLLVSKFAPDDFFKIYPRSLHAAKPEHDSNTAPLNEYPPNFRELSEQFRREAQYRCQKCKEYFALPHLRKYLHVHHVNGNRSDNTPQNFKILCVACHAEEPQHAHMRGTPAFAEFMRLSPTRKGRQTGPVNRS